LVRRKRSRRSRELVGGHFVSALVGFAVLKLTGPQAWAAAVGLSILAMYVTGTFHPQGGINPLLVVSRAGAGRRGAVDRVCLALAPLGSRPEMAAALAATGAGI
jgi:CBS-domain-containing membrane protein